MSEAENPATTLERLLKANMYVVKDDGSLANISVGTEWQSADAFKGYDGQVTIALAQTVDRKLESRGKLRRRESSLRVGVWVTEQPGATESARTIRGKVVEEVNRIIREKSVTPNQTRYDFYALGAGSQAHKAYSGYTEAAPHLQGAWTELSSDDYARLWWSEDNRVNLSRMGTSEFPSVLLGFKVNSRPNANKRIVLELEGYGEAPTANGLTIKVWNNNAASWVGAQSGGAEGSDETVSITLTLDLPDYVDSNGYVWLLARTSGTSDGQNPALLHCDYVSCTVTVKGITYCDIVSYREADRVDVKPTVFHTEFTVKSWFFENIIGV